MCGGRSTGSAETLEDAVTDAERVGHGRQGRVDRPDAGEDARVRDIQIVELMGLAVDIEDRRGRVGAKTDGSRLVRYACDTDFVLEIRRARDEMVRMHPKMAQHRLELGVERFLGSWLLGV